MPKRFPLPWKHKKEKATSLQRAEGAGSPSPFNHGELEATDSELAVGVSRGGRADRKGKSREITPALEPKASLGRTGWLALKKTLEIIRDGSDLCLPLKAVLVGVVAAMEMADNVKDARGGFLEIAHKIHGFEAISNHYESAEDVPPIIRRRLDRLSE
ncbi:hypothetical protein OBBRIDRAFT_804922 [Obba rivulosa]|uniref:Uncharacterized protein n=1 Tax=Obba rivulosa TaxID=1052685 RepID=A0A8E2AQL6_9APHY|nr:hypothetical protein OBBRIDRAFT_804922 [Obba rivulosa]